MKTVQLWIDQLLNWLCNKGNVKVMEYHDNEEPKQVHYERFKSSLIGVINESDEFEKGNRYTVVYIFDEHGTVLSRKSLKKIFKEKGELIPGTPEVLSKEIDHIHRDSTKQYRTLAHISEAMAI